MKKIYILLVAYLITTTCMAQRFTMLEMIDVERYTIELDLSDFTKRISGTAHIDFKIEKPEKVISFDLANTQNQGKTGMEVADVRMGEAITWFHEDDKLVIKKTEIFERNRKYRITIVYSGLPEDGLIISKNKHRDFTAFGDNWPNRAHHWFPCVDHPADKAIIEWKINFPSNLLLVGNGILVADSSVSRKIQFNHWQSTVPLPTKVMVIGLANFAVSEPCYVNDVAVTSWVFKKQADDGFSDYAVACDVLKWFEEKITDYPYAKLANVQSKTRYGGMENASCIFYYENSVNGKGEVEDLIAHEIAHQWFGNSATETDWPHLWLSEGFATYLTDVYIQEKYGNDAFTERLEGERDLAIRFYSKYKVPVVDTLSSDPKALLNANSYQKGAWFLHMLRNDLGDSLFWETIKTYYQFYQLGNASTADFTAVLNQVSGKDYSAFVKQWLLTAGHPNLKIESKLLKKGKLEISVVQQQKELFDFHLPVFVNCAPQGFLHTQHITKRRTKFTVDLLGEFEGLDFDPNVKLFFEHKYIAQD